MFLTSEGAVSSPQSFTGHSERIQSWVCQNKRQLYDELKSACGGDERAVATLEKLSKETGVAFGSDDFIRLGNLELCVPLNGNYSTPSNVSIHRLEQVNNTWRIVVQLANAAAHRQVAYARVRVRAVSPFSKGPIIAERLHCSNAPIVTEYVEELPRHVEVQWYDADGTLIELCDFQYLLDIAVSVDASNTQDLPAALRGELRQPMTGSSLVRSGPTPWVVSERDSAALRTHLFPRPDPDFHAFETEAQHRAFVKDFILRQDRRGRVIIADPYLDLGVLMTYVLRDRSKLRCDLTLILSTKTREATAITDYCKQNAYRLPERFRLLNLPRSEHGGAFHDRFAVLGSGESLQTWHLGSSINSYSRQYPLFAARARGFARAAWARYVEGLAEGDLGSGRAISIEVLFEQQAAPPWQFRSGRVVYGISRRFPGWARLLTALDCRRMKRWYDRFLRPRHLVRARNERGAETLRRLLHRGVFRENMQADNGWLIGPRFRPRTSRMLAAKASGDDKLVKALSEWAARGGLQPDQFHFDVTTISSMLRMVTSQVWAWRGRPRRWHVDKPRSSTFESILVHYSHIIEYWSDFEPTGMMPRWLAPFVVRAALHAAPERLFAAIASLPQGLRLRMYDLLLTSRWHVDRSAYGGGLRHQDKGIVALSLLLLREATPDWTLPARASTSLDEFEYAVAQWALRPRDRGLYNARDVAQLFDAMTFDEERLKRLLDVRDEIRTPARAALLDALALSRSGNEATFLRSTIIKDWENSVPLRSRWSVDSLKRDHLSEMGDRELIARQFLRTPNGALALGNLIGRLDFGAANAPFLRVRDYTTWNGLWRGILHVGAIATRVANAINNSEPLLESGLARLLRSLEPEVVQQLVDSDELHELLRLARALHSQTINGCLSGLHSLGQRARDAMNATSGPVDQNGVEGEPERPAG